MSAVRRMLSMLVVLVGFTAAAQAQVPPPGSPQARPPVDPQVRTLRVEGTGEVKAQPDEAFIDVAVETSAVNAKAAGEENAKRMEKVLAALTSAGIVKRDLQTRNYNVYPEYTPAPPQGESRSSRATA